MLPLLSDITLKQWIEYNNSLQVLNEQLKAINDSPDSHRKNILLTKNLVDKAYHTYSFFGNTEALYIDDVLRGYADFIAASNDIVKAPDPIATEDIEFGQFIDAKMLIAANEAANKTRWDILPYILSIFCYSPFEDTHTNENSVMYKAALITPLDKAIGLMIWFDELNNYIQEAFTLFQDSGEEEKAAMKEHMKRWGWVNFLKSIAKTKVFDISGSGMNSIDCARKAKMVEVLTWASEEKDYNLAMAEDMK